MEILTVTAPISIDQLKKYFVSKDIFYVIDYENSQLKGKKLLTYLSNLDIPSDISIDENSNEFEELLMEYLTSHTLIKSEKLEKSALKIMLCYKKLMTDTVADSFIENNKKIVEHWISIIDSLMLYNMHTLEVQEFKDHARSYENNDTIEGLNFVNLLKYPEFYFLFSEVKTDNLKFYNRFFDEPVYKGSPLFDFWANPNNDVFLMTWAIAEGEISAEEFSKIIDDESKLLNQNSL